VERPIIKSLNCTRFVFSLVLAVLLFLLEVFFHKDYLSVGREVTLMRLNNQLAEQSLFAS